MSTLKGRKAVADALGWSLTKASAARKAGLPVGPGWTISLKAAQEWERKHPHFKVTGVYNRSTRKQQSLGELEAVRSDRELLQAYRDSSRQLMIDTIRDAGLGEEGVETCIAAIENYVDGMAVATVLTILSEMRSLSSTSVLRVLELTDESARAAALRLGCSRETLKRHEDRVRDVVNMKAIFGCLTHKGNGEATKQ